MKEHKLSKRLGKIIQRINILVALLGLAMLIGVSDSGSERLWICGHALFLFFCGILCGAVVFGGHHEFGWPDDFLWQMYIGLEVLSSFTVFIGVMGLIGHCFELIMSLYLSAGVLLVASSLINKMELKRQFSQGGKSSAGNKEQALDDDKTEKDDTL